MKKIILILIAIQFFTDVTYSQIIYSHKIDSILNLVSVQSICRFDRELSGDTVVNIGGVPQIIYSRFYKSPGKLKAIEYLDEKFQSFGLIPKHMHNDDTSVNVYAVKTGTKYPNQKFIISGHYDNILWPVNPGIYDTVHGADDDASGVCAVLEAARLLANMDLDYTVLFVAHDEEEIGLYGSYAFADTCYFRGDSILGVLNLDMIAYDGNNDSKCMITYNTASQSLMNEAITCNQIYQIGLDIYTRINQGCDVQPYWSRGYKGIEIDEDYYGDMTPYLHKITETFDKLNASYFQKMIKIDIALLLTWAMDSRIVFTHIPVSSGLDTSVKIAIASLRIPPLQGKIATGLNAPRLYYKLNSGQFSFVNAFEINGDIYKFRIPGAPAGSKITYYIAAQDSTGTLISTLPLGGSGVNPPGTTPPPTQYVYYVWTSSNNFCSNNTKPINDFEWTLDTIHITQQGIVRDADVTLNLNHTNDGDLLIRLAKLNSLTNLSQFNGQGGQNYTGTIFDDSATTPITQGTPPFTGRFRPQGSLSNFDGQQMGGDWVLMIYDINNGSHGNLLNWCIQFKYENSIGVKEKNIIVNEYKLFQNYPNPFNPNTNIKFQVAGYKVIKLSVFDILGREIKTLVNEKLKPGEYDVMFDGSGLASGVYYYKLAADSFTDIKRMVLIK